MSSTTKYYDIVAVELKNRPDVVLCSAPRGSFLEAGDRVIVSSNKTGELVAGLDGVCVSGTKYIDSETANIISTICPEQFPLRYVKARYHFETFANPNDEEESEVLNA